MYRRHDGSLLRAPEVNMYIHVHDHHRRRDGGRRYILKRPKKKLMRTVPEYCINGYDICDIVIMRIRGVKQLLFKTVRNAYLTNANRSF